jgi:hypothetical protein
LRLLGCIGRGEQSIRRNLETEHAKSKGTPGTLAKESTMNAKQEPLKDPESTRPLTFDRAAFDAWDTEIRQVLPPAKLITPDDVRGRYNTLEAAVLAHAWPTVERARGRFCSCWTSMAQLWKLTWRVIYPFAGA